MRVLHLGWVCCFRTRISAAGPLSAVLVTPVFVPYSGGGAHRLTPRFMAYCLLASRCLGALVPSLAGDTGPIPNPGRQSQPSYDPARGRLLSGFCLSHRAQGWHIPCHSLSSEPRGIKHNPFQRALSQLSGFGRSPAHRLCNAWQHVSHPGSLRRYFPHL